MLKGHCWPLFVSLQHPSAQQILLCNNFEQIFHLIFQSSLARYAYSKICTHYNFMCLPIVIRLVRVSKYVLRPYRLLETGNERMLLRLICLAVQKTLIIVAGSNSALTEVLQYYCTGKPTELVIQTSWKEEYISMLLFKMTVKEYGYLCFMKWKR